ncbi:Uncharacterised protein [Legionella oakridgensis]|nr:Uncharacterised protein [Legionella oakridgensis]
MEPNLASNFKAKSPLINYLLSFNANPLISEGFCRENFFKLRTELFWASLCREPIELFKNSLTGRLIMLPFTEHMM